MKQFEKLLSYLREKNVFVIDLLQTGLSDEAIEKLFATHKLNLYDNVREIYKTVDGTLENDAALGLQYLFPGSIMLPLEKAFALYEEECIEYNSWEKGFVPIFWNGNRDYLLVDCLNKSEGVYFYSPDEFRFEGLARKYDTLELLFATVLQCFEVKAYGLGRTLEEITYDGDLVIKISKEMNPNSSYWDFKTD